MIIDGILREKLCKRGYNYIASRKRKGEKHNPFLTARAVKVCKGQMSGTDGKTKKDFRPKKGKKRSAQGAKPDIIKENKYLLEAKYKKFLNEAWEDAKADVINEFVNYCMEYLSVDRPKIKLINSKDYAFENRSLGGYIPSEKKIMVVVHNRNMADILRTLAHEMVHHMQNLDNRLTNTSGEDGSPDENEANSLAAVIMRKFGRDNPHIYE